MDSIAKKQPKKKAKKPTPVANQKQPSDRPGGQKKDTSSVAAAAAATATKKTGGKKTNNKEKDKATEEEKEEKKKQKLQKKKALDERDLNILGQLSQLNKAVVVVDHEHGRVRQEKEKELERETVEKEVQRRDNSLNKENNLSQTEYERVEDDHFYLDRLRESRSDDEDEEEDNGMKGFGTLWNLKLTACKLYTLTELLALLVKDQETVANSISSDNIYADI